MPGGSTEGQAAVLMERGHLQRLIMLSSRCNALVGPVMFACPRDMHIIRFVIIQGMLAQHACMRQTWIKRFTAHQDIVLLQERRCVHQL